MLASTILLLMNSAFFTLRLGNRAGSFPRPLSAKEEKEYVKKWCEGDMDARNHLIEHNMRLVAHIVKKYYTPDSDSDDLISIGTIGLIKGVSTYRPDKGVRLATYASRCIENEVLMHFRGIRKSSGDVSLSESIDADSDGNALSLMDILADENDLAETLSAKDLCCNIHHYIDNNLDKREAIILSMRYGLNGEEPKTQRETAECLGISRSYISRIEKKALEKLRRVMDDT